MNQVMELLKTADGMILAAAFFAAGMIFMCLVCKLFKKPCGCGHKNDRQTGGKFCRKNAERIEKKHPAPADGSIEIYVGNLSYDLTEDVLRKEFEAFGKVNSARIITNRYNGRSKGFGFVHMPNREEVEAAIKALSEKDILGRKLKCNVAKNVI